MGKLIRWGLALVLALVAVMAIAAFALGRWANTDDFRARAQQAASQALGAPVQLGRIEVALWPVPGVAIHDTRIQTRPPLTLRRVEARPVWTALLVGRPELDALVVRDAVLPQQAIDALAAAAEKKGGAKSAPASGAMPPLPRRIVLDGVTWIDAKGQPLTLDAEVQFAGELLPQSAHLLVVDGRFRGAKAQLARETESWRLKAEIGGGTIAGPLRLQPAKGGGWRFSGELATDRVEVAALTAPGRTLTGRLEARTTLQADFRDPGQLADVLRTQTRFTVRNAVLHGVDLAQAVRTLGVSRSGQTAFDTLSGQVATQGRAVHLTQLVANSGALSAKGNVSISPERTLNGRVGVDLVAGPIGAVAGVPLQIGGTLDAPSATPAGVSLPGSHAASQLGDKLGQGLKGLFGR